MMTNLPRRNTLRTRLNASFVFFAILLQAATYADAQSRSPKRELRTAWIATVSNIDWPSRQGLPASEQQAQFIRRLDEMKALGCNAVIVQIRPAADAFYESPFEPWSRFLTGRQGQPPVPMYDPLTFMTEEAHKRCMEFHAWFNPFRALTDSKKNPNPLSHVTKTHPDWIVSYDGKSYINPGIPAARQYVVDVMTDVVKRYDIDAVHLDDYFYPYRVAGKEFGDAVSYSKWGGSFAKDDWRRRNITDFVLTLNAAIKKEKSWMKLGISPFGVWRNFSKDPDGSATRGGQTCYDDLYSDVRYWMQEGIIDYCMPQLYWERGHRLADFNVLLPWWEAHRYKRHCYYGLGLYRMLPPAKGTWTGSAELTAQIRALRNTGNPTGFSLYSISNFDKIRAPIRDSIARLNALPALPPAMPWLDSIAPLPPKLTAIRKGDVEQLSWDVLHLKKEPLRYAVYRFAAGEKVDLERADRIISIGIATTFTDFNPLRGDAIYVVTAIDRTWNESKGSIGVAVMGR